MYKLKKWLSLTDKSYNVYIKLFKFLFLFLFFVPALASPPVFFKPDFTGTPTAIPSGTMVLPLCSNPMDPRCMSQWSQQAIPLAVHPGATGSSPQFQYFLPSFIPSGVLQGSPENNEEWEVLNFPSFSSFGSRGRRARGSNEDVLDEEETGQESFKFAPKKARVVETEQTVKEEAGSLKPEGDTATVDESSKEDRRRGIVTSSIASESAERETPPVKAAGTLKTEAAPSQPGRRSQQVSDKPPPQPEFTVLKNTRTGETMIAQKDSRGDQTYLQGEIMHMPLGSLTRSRSGIYQTNRDVHALPSTVKEVQPGCFMIDKQEEQTEAGFCFECRRRGDEEYSVVYDLIERDENFLSLLKKHLQKVSSEARGKISSKTPAVSDLIQKICSPDISLKDIINNFNKNCPEPYKNNFEKFFKITNCESCKKGVPPEIMMAMVSIESAGKCPAESTTQLEDSVGLFQINAKVHGCRDYTTGRSYTPTKSLSNVRKCLKNPINGLNKAVDILSDHYKKVNLAGLDTSQCKSWLEMDSTERDKWRRAVSAYNGGPGWVLRAIYSARNKLVSQSTQHLKWTHSCAKMRKKRKDKGKITVSEFKEKYGTNTVNWRKFIDQGKVDLCKVVEEHRKDKASWEELRSYYFTEKLSQRVDSGERSLNCGKSTRERGTGRKLSCTLSNLAHTEAVLGRNMKGSGISMVEIWSQYKRGKPSVSCPEK